METLLPAGDTGAMHPCWKGGRLPYELKLMIVEAAVPRELKAQMRVVTPGAHMPSIDELEAVDLHDWRHLQRLKQFDRVSRASVDRMIENNLRLALLPAAQYWNIPQYQGQDGDYIPAEVSGTMRRINHFTTYGHWTLTETRDGTNDTNIMFLASGRVSASKQSGHNRMTHLASQWHINGASPYIAPPQHWAEEKHPMDYCLTAIEDQAEFLRDLYDPSQQFTALILARDMINSLTITTQTDNDEYWLRWGRYFGGRQIRGRQNFDWTEEWIPYEDWKATMDYARRWREREELREREHSADDRAEEADHET